MTEILTPRDVAAYFHVQPSTVLRWAREKKLPALRVQVLIRFKKSEVDRWLEDQRVSNLLNDKESKNVIG